jgi:molybdopterin converting factor subunit 1
MQCTVLFFAQARDLAGCERMSIDLPRAATAGDALEAIMRLHPALQPLRDRMAVAVDERYARLEAPLSDGCTIALIPPVSGG